MKAHTLRSLTTGTVRANVPHVMFLGTGVSHVTAPSPTIGNKDVDRGGTNDWNATLSGATDLTIPSTTIPYKNSYRHRY